RKVARVHRLAGNRRLVLVVRGGEQAVKTPGRDTDPGSFLIVHLGLRQQRGAGRGYRCCQKLSTIHSDSSPTADYRIPRAREPYDTIPPRERDEIEPPELHHVDCVRLGDG